MQTRLINRSKLWLIITVFIGFITVVVIDLVGPSLSYAYCLWKVSSQLPHHLPAELQGATCWPINWRVAPAVCFSFRLHRNSPLRIQQDGCPSRTIWVKWSTGTRDHDSIIHSLSLSRDKDEPIQAGQETSPDFAKP